MPQAETSQPFVAQCVLFLDEAAKAAIVLKHGYETERPSVNPAIQKLIRSGMPYAQCVKEPHGDEYLEYADEAHDVLCDSQEQNFRLLNEFRGKIKRRSDGTLLEHEDGADLLVLLPAKSPDMFTQAYPYIQALAAEYQQRLKPLLGTGFDVTAHIADVSGTFWQ